MIKADIDSEKKIGDAANDLCGTVSKKYYKNHTFLHKTTHGFCHSTPLAEVKKQDYKLTPGIYVGMEAEIDDGIPFEEKMEPLKTKLSQQFEKSNVLQERIKSNVNKI